MQTPYKRTQELSQTTSSKRKKNEAKRGKKECYV